MATVLSNKISTYGSPYAYYTVSLTPINRTDSSVTINCNVSAYLNTASSSMGYGITCGVYIGGSWHNFVLIPYGTTWRGTTPISASATITVYGLSPSQTNITGIQFQAVSGAPEMGAGLNATSCYDLVVDSYSGSGSSGGGGTGGGDSGSSGDNDYNYSSRTCTLYITEGLGTTLNVETVINGVVTTVYDGYFLQILSTDEAYIRAYYDVDDGNIINEHTMNGNAFQSGVLYYIPSGYLEIRTSAIPYNSGSGGSGSGGSGEGGSGGDGSDGSVGIGEITYCPITIMQGEHTIVSVYGVSAEHHGYLRSGDSFPWRFADGMNTPYVHIEFESDEDFLIDEHTVNGEVFESGSTIKYPESIEIKTTAKMNGSVSIDDGNNLSSYACCIDNGDKWEHFVPYVSVHNYENWDGLFNIVVIDGINVYSVANSYVGYKIDSISPGVNATVEEITHQTDSNGYMCPWFRISYQNKTGWISAYQNNISYRIYVKVNKPNNVYVYDNTNLNNALIELNDVYEIYVDEMITSKTDKIGHVIAKAKYGAMYGINFSGYIKMDDVDILTERDVINWVKIKS